MIPTIHKGKLYASEYEKPESKNYLYNDPEYKNGNTYDLYEHIKDTKLWESQLLEVDNDYTLIPYHSFQIKQELYIAHLWIKDKSSYLRFLLKSTDTIKINPTTKGHCKIIKINEDF